MITAEWSLFKPQNQANTIPCLKNAIATGIVDRVLRPEEIPAELVSYEKYVLRAFDKSAVLAMRDQIWISLN